MGLQENGEESFEQLQDLFDEMFQRDNSCDAAYPSTSSQGSCSFSNGGSTEGSCINNKRNSLGMNATEASSSFNNINSDSFCLGVSISIKSFLHLLMQILIICWCCYGLFREDRWSAGEIRER